MYISDYFFDKFLEEKWLDQKLWPFDRLLLDIHMFKDIFLCDRNNTHFSPKEHMNDKNISKAVEQQQKEEEDEKIRKFIKAKKHLTQMRKEKEAETHR